MRSRSRPQRRAVASMASRAFGHDNSRKCAMRSPSAVYRGMAKFRISPLAKAVAFVLIFAAVHIVVLDVVAAAQINDATGTPRNVAAPRQWGPAQTPNHVK